MTTIDIYYTFPTDDVDQYDNLAGALQDYLDNTCCDDADCGDGYVSVEVSSIVGCELDAYVSKLKQKIEDSGAFCTEVLIDRFQHN